MNADMIFDVRDLAVHGYSTYKAEFRGSDRYFYAEGLEFRLEYIHDRIGRLIISCSG